LVTKTKSGTSGYLTWKIFREIRMHKFGYGVMVILLVLILGSAAIVFGQADEEMCVEMGIIPLSAPEGVESKRAEVEFPHSIHFGFDCRTCHHKWESTEVIQGCTTSGCHDVTVAPTRAEKRTMKAEEAIKYYKTAYHNMCIGCHKEMKKINKELEMSHRKLDKELPRTGPTGCHQCHPKE
jgi:hypothetical protein